MAKNPRTLALFDIDGTLTAPRDNITAQMQTFLEDLRTEVTVGVVGGSDLSKQKEQLGKDVLDCFDYNFSENGLVAYKDGNLIGTMTIQDYLGEESLQEIINWILRYLSDITLPIKRGTFIEFRTGMMNVSPIGRNCSRAERNDFEEYDRAHKIRSDMVNAMRKEFGSKYNLTFSIGGQISFDVFPTGWDKTYCLKFLPESDFDTIHFFGDKTFEGGNDYEIFSHPRVIGHSVTSPDDTMEQCREIFYK